MMNFVYTNHRNETRERSILPYVLAWEDNDGIREYGYEPGLFVTGIDTERNVQRSFSVKRMVPTTGTTIIHDFREYIPKQSVVVLVEACERLITELLKTPSQRDITSPLTNLQQLVNFYK